MVAGCEVLKDKEKSFPDLMLDFIKSRLGSRADDDPHDRSTLQVKAPPFQNVIFIKFHIFS
jgi:hypothetical protein